MILRRLSQSLKEQNWTAITVEFVLLVAGVFLGIQAANWNEQRVEGIKANAYLQRVRGNLQTDLQSIGRREVFWQKVLDYGGEAVRYAETGERVDGSAWKTVLAFYQASQLWQWVPADATYQEMRSGGVLGLIRDEVLREGLSQYYLESGSGVDYLFYLQPEYRKIVRGLTPSVVADHVWTHCWAQASLQEQQLLDCDPPITEAQAQAVLDAYLRHPDLLPELRFWMANQRVALNVLSNYRGTLDAMIARSQERAP